MLKKLSAAVAALSSFSAPVAAIELTPDNWDSSVSGKSVFIKFLAPWWGHCKSMKPAWDKLMGEYQNNPSSLIADVDCTADGKPLCDKHGVQGFPTIKYGDPTDMKDYNGGRDYDTLKQFAMNHLGPQCGPGNLELCTDPNVKAKYEKLMKMSKDKLESKIRLAEKAFYEEVPMMKKIVGWIKKEADGKGDKKEEL